jgi:hypothetical protein
MWKKLKKIYEERSWSPGSSEISDAKKGESYAPLSKSLYTREQLAAKLSAFRDG